MSEIKVNSIKGVGATDAAITVNNSDGTCTANITNRSNKNIVINGQFDIWQRNTDSGSSSSDGYITSDRWYAAASGATRQITRQAFDLGQTDVPSNPKYFLRYAVTTANNNVALRQRIEGVDTVQGAVTLSFYAKGTNPAGGSFDIINRQNFGTGGSPSGVVDTSVGSFSVTSSWARKTFTFTPPSISGKTLGTNNNDYYELDVFRQPDGDTGTAAYTIDIANVQLEVGSVATDFEHRSYAQELLLCQRYYEVLVSGSGKTWGGAAVMYQANQTHHQCTFVEKRATPTLDYVSGTNYYRYYGNETNASSTTLSQFLYVTNKSAGIVANLGGNLLKGGAAFSYTTDANAFVAISAEL